MYGEGRYLATRETKEKTLAHALEQDDSMASGNGIMPWHGLGAVMPNRNMRSSEAIELAKLNWTISMRQVFTQLERDGKLEYMEVPQTRAIVRDDTNRILGTAGEAYHPVQNSEAFDFIDELVGEKNGAYIETCGSLHNGAVVWVMVALKDTINVKGVDPIKPYLLFTNRNTGRRAVELSQVNTRVVCANTLSFAEGEGKEGRLRFRHVGGLLKNTDHARQMILVARENNKAAAELFERMADAAATPERIDVVLEILLPGNPLAKADVVKRTETLRERVKVLADYGKGNEQFRGSWWGVYNGVTEWADHHKQIARGPKDKASTMAADETRLISNWFGPSAQLKTKALDLIAHELPLAKTFSVPAEPMITGTKQRHHARALKLDGVEAYTPQKKLWKNMTKAQKRAELERQLAEGELDQAAFDAKILEVFPPKEEKAPKEKKERAPKVTREFKATTVEELIDEIGNDLEYITSDSTKIHATLGAKAIELKLGMGRDYTRQDVPKEMSTKDYKLLAQGVEFIVAQRKAAEAAEAAAAEPVATTKGKSKK